MKRVATIDGELIVEHDDGTVTFRAKAAIDCDGSGGNPWNDPYFQDDTSLHHDGKALNAETVPFIVLPPSVILGVDPIVLGCKARVWNLMNGKKIEAVVGDVGPKTKIGEVSVECARRLGIPESPISGGVDDHIIFFRVWPGVPAKVDGVKYAMQPYG